MDSQNCQTPEYPALAHFNSQIDALLPFVTEAEIATYTIWEHDPEFGRQVALTQPLDRLDIQGIAIPWLKGIVSETREHFRHKIMTGIHDPTIGEPL